MPLIVNALMYARISSAIVPIYERAEKYKHFKQNIKSEMMSESETSEEFLKRMFGDQVDNSFFDTDHTWMSNAGSEVQTTLATDESLDLSQVLNHSANFAELSSGEFQRTPRYHDSTSLAIEVGVLKQQIEDLRQK